MQAAAHCRENMHRTCLWEQKSIKCKYSVSAVSPQIPVTAKTSINFKKLSTHSLCYFLPVTFLVSVKWFKIVQLTTTHVSTCIYILSNVVLIPSSHFILHVPAWLLKRNEATSVRNGTEAKDGFPNFLSILCHKRPSVYTRGVLLQPKKFNTYLTGIDSFIYAS